MRSTDLLRSARKCEAEYGVPGLTIYIAEVPDIVDLIDQAGRFVQQYSVVQICSLAVLEDYEVVPTGKAPHYTLVLPSTSEDQFDRLRQCFLAIPNPLVSE
ncbi:MAG: hypothetical protein WB565_03760 [Acidimicrobiales bacterium]